MMMWYLFIVFTSIFAFMTDTPIFLGIAVITQAILYSVVISMINVSSWPAYILFIILIGGVLIVFLFVVITLSQMKMFLINKNFLLTFPLVMCTTVWFLTNMDFYSSSDINLFYNFKFLDYQQSVFMMLISSDSLMKMSIMLITILFLLMIMVVFLTTGMKASMSHL